VRGVEPSSSPSGAGVGGDAVTFTYNISPKGNKNNYYLQSLGILKKLFAEIFNFLIMKKD
jgi:hypothetical protein